MVFGHQHRDTQVEAEYVGVVPAGQWIEGVNETVARPRLAILRANVVQHAYAVVEEKWQRPARRAGHDAAVDGTDERRAAPRRVASHVVGRADPPEIVSVVGELL